MVNQRDRHQAKEVIAQSSLACNSATQQSIKNVEEPATKEIETRHSLRCRQRPLSLFPFFRASMMARGAFGRLMRQRRLARDYLCRPSLQPKAPSPRAGPQTSSFPDAVLENIPAYSPGPNGLARLSRTRLKIINDQDVRRYSPPKAGSSIGDSPPLRYCGLECNGLNQSRRN